MNLYEVTQEMRELDDMARRGEDWNEDGEVIDLHALIDAAKGTAQGKVEHLCKLREEAKADSIACAATVKRLQKRAKAAANLADGYQDWISTCMDLGKVKKIKTETHTVTLQTFKSVRVEDLEKLPIAYRSLKIIPDKRPMLAALKAGESVLGAILIETKKAVIR